MISVKQFPDGKVRCGWLNDDPLYIDYHDIEWGTKTTGQRELFEGICLEGFQAGLSWYTILKRRENFRRAFDHFEIELVAGYQPDKVEELLTDPGIIRNRAKINSAIHNARLILDKKIDLTQLLWRYEKPPGSDSVGEFQWQATTPESDALSKEMKRLGFSFVGSTTMYALMQSTGIVQDHAPGCFRRP